MKGEKAERKRSKSIIDLHPMVKLYHLLTSRDRLKVVGLFLMMIVGGMFEVLGIGLIPAFMIALSSPETVQKYPSIANVLSWLNFETTQELMMYGIGALALVYVFKNLYISFLIYTKSTFVRNLMVVIGKKLFTSYMTAPYTFHLGRNSSELLRNTNMEVKQLTTQVLTNLLKFAMDSIMIIFVFAFLIISEPQITLITFAVLGGASGLFLRFIKGKVNRYGLIEQRERKNMIKAVTQGLGGLKETRVLNVEGFFIESYHKSVKRSAKAARFKEVANQTTKPFIETMAVFGLLLILLLLTLQGRELDSVIPVFALFGAATVRLMPAFKELVTSYTNVKYAIFSIDPIYDDLDLLKNNRKSEVKPSSGQPSFDRSLRVSGLRYAYPNTENEALSGIDLTIEAGQAVAFVGPSGVGKTTLVDIILGLLDPTQGTVSSGGQSIQENMIAWQKRIGYIPQQIFLGDFSIRENIAWGIEAKNIDQNRVDEAMKAAQLAEFVVSLPKGLETIVGERGVRLSGGQRQRIGIARALYHNPDILVMDEATSALDNETEKYVIEAIENLKGSRTIIMIAHRLTTVKNCDVIYEMKDGQIARSGTYADLY